MDLTLPVTGAGAVVAGVGWLAKKGIGILVMKARRWDKHLEECRDKAVNHGRLEEKFIALEDKMDLRFDATNEKVDALAKQIDRLDRRLK